LINDTIRVPIELMDEDGVAHVRAIFRRLRYVGELGPRGFDPDHILEVRGNGQSQKHTTVETTLKVAEEHEPGDYLCIAIHGYDSNGNLTTINNPMPSRVFKIVDEGKKDDTVTEFLG
jgi:muconolactone delta-isomerase